jgi:hypothetical protein
MNRLIDFLVLGLMFMSAAYVTEIQNESSTDDEVIINKTELITFDSINVEKLENTDTLQLIDSIKLDTVIEKVEPLVFADAKFEAYMNTNLRKKLTSHVNDATVNPRADDAGNWTGGVQGKGKLVGTYRDIAAVTACAYYGKKTVTPEELRAIDENEAKRIIKWIWDSINASEIPDQDVANITMHIKMHYGNIRIVQRALNSLGENLKLSGTMNKPTLKALQKHTKSDAINTYNVIRTKLKHSYSRSNPVYRKGFMRIIENDFPLKNKNKDEQ